MTDFNDVDDSIPNDQDETVVERIQDRLAGFRNRRITRIVVAYTLSLWLVVQLADVSFPLLQVPEYALIAIIIVGVLALPFVLGVAWLVEYGFGCPRNKDEPDEQRKLTASVTALLMLTTCALASVIALRALA